MSQSPFLQALGYAIINSLWQFALLWLIYVLLNTILKLSSHQKYAAGLLLQAGGFIWFTVTFSFCFRQYSQLSKIFFPLQKSYSVYIVQSNAVTGREKIFAWMLQTEKMLPYLSVAYLILLVLLGCKWIKAYNLTQSIKAKGLIKIEADWRLFVKQLSNQLGIKREVKIYLSEMVETPLTIGFFKPFILIPLASLNHLSSEQMEAVILHELAHIKRFDYLFNLFLALVETTLFFNPFMILISRHIKRERENCCDDWVLQYNYNAASYAGALLQIATCQSAYSLLALKAADNKQVLLNRIKRMIEKKESTFFNYRYQLLALVVMLTVLSSLALISSRENINKANIPASAGHVIVTSMSKIVNPYFFMTSDEEKAINGNKFPTEKITNKNFSFDTSIARKIISVADAKTSNQKLHLKPLIAEKNRLIPSTPKNPPAPPIPGNPADPGLPGEMIAAHLEKSIEALNVHLVEVKFPAAAVKEWEIALAEDHFKELAKNLFEKNKTIIDQKQVITQIKAALDQLKTIKIELNSVNKKNSIAVAGNAERVNQLRIRTQNDLCNTERLQTITKQLQLLTEKADKQRQKAHESNHRYYKNLAIPNVIYQLPFQEKPHSFSFEFSEKPKVKVEVPNSFKRSLNKGKKVNKIVVIDDDNVFEQESLLPALEEKSRPKVTLNRNFYTIRI